MKQMILREVRLMPTSHQKWRIHNFPIWGRGHPQNCMKIKEIGSGGVVRPWRPRPIGSTNARSDSSLIDFITFLLFQVPWPAYAMTGSAPGLPCSLEELSQLLVSSLSSLLQTYIWFFCPLDYSQVTHTSQSSLFQETSS